MKPVTYRYCPLCAEEIGPQGPSGQNRHGCPACGFVHFQDPKVAVVAVIPWQNRVLLIQRRFGPAKGRWALPGGFMDAWEMPRDALAREVREEVGLAVSPGALLDILSMDDPDVGPIGIVIAYTALPISVPSEMLTVADDAAAARWFYPEALPEGLAFRGTRRLIRLWQRGVIVPA
ncbi:MAG: NUDIX hydrolase [Pseudomonadota bacterium]